VVNGNVNNYIACAAARDIEKISTENKTVVGVTSVDDELFVLLCRYTSWFGEGCYSYQVEAYSINDYKLLHYPMLPEYKSNEDSDMVSCVRRKCLYMSDYVNCCIHRYNLASSATNKWSVPGSPRGLSLTLRGNLLVTCPDKLVGLSADNGQCVREIALQADIASPWHSVELTTGQYVVCHGLDYSNLNRVCLVGADGKVTRSYGGQLGSDMGQLNRPYHLAVDNDSQFIFVADEYNDRVVLLSPTLEFVRYVSEKVSVPCRLYFDHTTRRLFVGLLRGGVAVIQL